MIRPKRYLMKLADREVQLGDRTLIMGIINVTPDSFSDGGSNMDPARAAERAGRAGVDGTWLTPSDSIRVVRFLAAIDEQRGADAGFIQQGQQQMGHVDLA
mgnify:CR=1 FL=1